MAVDKEMKSFKEYISERLLVHYKKGRKVVAIRGSKEGETGTVVSMGPHAAYVMIQLDTKRQGKHITVQQNPKAWKAIK